MPIVLCSTSAEDARIFVAKVIAIDDEADLMEFARLPDQRRPLYRAVPDSSWREPPNSLIFPIDIVWHDELQAYELRSTVDEIYSSLARSSALN